LDCAAYQSCDSGLHRCLTSAGFCDSDGQCNSWELCNPANHTCQPKLCSTGKCLSGQFFGCKADGTGYTAAVNCLDGKPCKQDLCDPALGCSHPVVGDGTACDDGKGCPGDLCQAGTCVGVPLALEATFGTVPYAMADRLAVSEDGGFVGIGRARQVVGAPMNAWAFKIDGKGKLLWQVHYPAGEKALNGVASDGAGGLFAVGTEASDPVAIRLDATGKTVWTKYIAEKGGQVSSAVLLPDQSLVAGGTAAPSSASAPTLWHIAADGSPLGSFTPPAPAPEAGGQINAMTMTPAGHIAIAGARYHQQVPIGSVTWHAWAALIKVDFKAVVSEAFVDGGGTGFGSVAALPNGGLAATRGTPQGVTIQRFDAALKSVWTTSAQAVLAGAVVATPDGQLAYVGQAYSLNMPALGVFDGVFIPLDPANGTSLGTYQVGRGGPDAFLNGVGTAEGFALHGYASAPGNVRRAWLVRPDASGHTACACIGGSKSEVCDDGNSCTLDSCDPSTGCQHKTAVDGAACDDASPFSAGLTCTAGKCAGCNHATVAPVANITNVALMAIAPDGSLRAELTNSYTSATRLVRIDEDGKVPWNKTFSSFTTAGMAQYLAVREDGATDVLVYENGPWKHYGFLVDGTPMSPPSTPGTGIAPTAVYWTADGKLAELIYDTSGEQFREYVGNWGALSSSPNWTQSAQKSVTGSVEAVASPGPTPGDLTLCYRSSVSTSGVLFVRRNGNSGAWSSPVSVSVTGDAQCMPANSATGVVVANKVGGAVKQIIRFDANGMAAWTATEPWIASAWGFVKANENFYAWGQTDSYSPWQVWRLDASGNAVATATLGKATSYTVGQNLVGARAVGNAIVLCGYTQYTPTPKLGYEYPVRAQVDLTPAFVCLP
ncbi:MAG: hypothetical protein HY902_00770, partial [Deltaproteobacteria bacterium]|nr:hypothetical protein [Deltaproteobacteria bacterium]